MTSSTVLYVGPESPVSEAVVSAVEDGSVPLPARRCSVCGSRIDATEWHPLTTRVGDDGEFHVYAFCDADCRAAWGGG